MKEQTYDSIYMTLWDKTKTETKTSGAEKRSAVARARKGSRRGLTSKMHEKKSLGLRNVLYLGCPTRKSPATCSCQTLGMWLF